MNALHQVMNPFKRFLKPSANTQLNSMAEWPLLKGRHDLMPFRLVLVCKRRTCFCRTMDGHKFTTVMGFCLWVLIPYRGGVVTLDTQVNHWAGQMSHCFSDSLHKCVCQFCYKKCIKLLMILVFFFYLHWDTLYLAILQALNIAVFSFALESSGRVLPKKVEAVTFWCKMKYCLSF